MKKFKANQMVKIPSGLGGAFNVRLVHRITAQTPEVFQSWLVQIDMPAAGDFHGTTRYAYEDQFEAIS